MASPEASPTETGSPADEADSATAIAVIQNYAACYNEGQATGDPGLYVVLESTTYVTSQGYVTRYDRVDDELGSPFKTAKLLSVDNVMLWGDGRISADVQVLLGPYWFNEWRVFLTKQGDTWLWDQEVSLPSHPDVDTVAVNGINITETKDESTGDITYAFVSYSGSWDFTETDAIIFNFTNSGQEAHEAILMQLPEGADPMGLLDGSVAFEDVTFIGGVFDIRAGHQRRSHGGWSASWHLHAGLLLPGSGWRATCRARDDPAVQHRGSRELISYTWRPGRNHPPRLASAGFPATPHD